MKDKSEIDSLVGQNLRAIRKMNGLTMTQVADELGVTYQQVQKYESGKNRLSASVLFKTAAMLGVKVEDFYSGASAYEPRYKSESDVTRNVESSKLYEAYSKIEDEKKRKMVLSLLDTLAD